MLINGSWDLKPDYWGPWTLRELPGPYISSRFVFVLHFHGGLNPKPHLEGQGDLVSRLMIRIIRVTIWVIGVINLLTKSP